MDSVDGYTYKKVDAFTAGGSLGNPAACLYLKDDETLSDAQMLEVARGHKGFVSEVVFCKRGADGNFGLRYFSSECEVPFCGHGTIACMAALIEDTPALQTEKEILIHTRLKGDITIYNRLAKQNAVYISAPEPVCLTAPVSAGIVAEKLGISETAVSRAYPMELIDAGNRTLIVPIEKFENVIGMFPNEQRLKEFTSVNDIDIVLVFCLETQDKTYAAHTRVFAAKYGYLEDPATGSGNAAFGYYMQKNKLWDGKEITVEQGGKDRIFNTVHLCVEKGKLLFGGSATTRIDGVYFI